MIIRTLVVSKVDIILFTPYLDSYSNALYVSVSY
jgi:hypothetical protein